jgi:hypothetical protein
MSMQTVSLNKAYGGTQGVYRHASGETRTDMTFSVYVPPHDAGTRRLSPAPPRGQCGVGGPMLRGVYAPFPRSGLRPAVYGGSSRPDRVCTEARSWGFPESHVFWPLRTSAAGS